MAKPGRYRVDDRAKGQYADLASFGLFNARFLIIDRETNKVVDEADTMYLARQIVKNLNSN